MRELAEVPGETTINGIARVFTLLRLVGEAEAGGLRLTEAAQRAGLPRPTVHRLLRSLATEGAIAFDARTKRYTLGLGLFLLAARAGNVLGLRDIARPVLLRLDMQAGHGVGSTQQQRQSMAADMQSFLLWQMGKAALKD